jgi:hypothetical protein
VPETTQRYQLHMHNCAKIDELRRHEVPTDHAEVRHKPELHPMHTPASMDHTRYLRFSAVLPAPSAQIANKKNRSKGCG